MTSLSRSQIREGIMARLCIKQVAQKEKLKQQDIAEKAGVTVQLLSRYWNNNVQRVDLDELEKIAKAIGSLTGQTLKTRDLIIDNDEPSAA
jgi:transcriptional regulator with XRE-family HTH domain